MSISGVNIVNDFDHRSRAEAAFVTCSMLRDYNTFYLNVEISNSSSQYWTFGAVFCAGLEKLKECLSVQSVRLSGFITTVLINEFHGN
jgi:hypothetical protein